MKHLIYWLVYYEVQLLIYRRIAYIFVCMFKMLNVYTVYK